MVKGGEKAGRERAEAKAAASDSDEELFASCLPQDNSDSGDDALAPLMSAGMGIAKKKPARPPAKDLSTEDCNGVM